MTCIVGFIDDDKNIYIGADSAGTNGWFDQRIRKDEKVFIKDDLIFGFTGSFRMGQLLKYQLNVPDKTIKDSDEDYINSKVIESIRKLLKDKGFTRIQNNQEEGGIFILGYRGKIYIIESDFQVGIVDTNYCSVGCAENYAMGCLYGIQKIELSPEQRIKKALKCAYKFSAGVKPPFIIKKLEYEE